MALTQVQSGMLGTGAALGNIPAGSITPTYLSTQSQYTGFKNRIINGGMTVSQRGASFSATGYTLDRWNLTQATTPTVTQSTDVPSGFRNSISVSGSNYLFLCQRIEANNVADLSGQAVTISFWAKQTSGTLSAFVVALDFANASNNFSSTTEIGTPNVGTLTSTWTYYTVTYPSLPAGVLNGLQLRFYIANPSACTYLVTGVQLEKGSVATSFDFRSIGTELGLCQRYYEALSANASGALSAGQFITLGVCETTTRVQAYYPFKVQKRVTPSTTLSTISSFGIRSTGSSVACSSGTFGSYSTAYAQGEFNNAGGGLVAGGCAWLTNQTGSATIEWSAEL